MLPGLTYHQERYKKQWHQSFVSEKNGKTKTNEATPVFENSRNEWN